jgi:hypothetical protein
VSWDDAPSAVPRARKLIEKRIQDAIGDHGTKFNEILRYILVVFVFYSFGLIRRLQCWLHGRAEDGCTGTGPIFGNMKLMGF